MQNVYTHKSAAVLSKAPYNIDENKYLRGQEIFHLIKLFDWNRKNQNMFHQVKNETNAQIQQRKIVRIKMKSSKMFNLTHQKRERVTDFVPAFTSLQTKI